MTKLILTSSLNLNMEMDDGNISLPKRINISNYMSMHSVFIYSEHNICNLVFGCCSNSLQKKTPRAILFHAALSPAVRRFRPFCSRKIWRATPVERDKPPVVGDDMFTSWPAVAGDEHQHHQPSGSNNLMFASSETGWWLKQPN